MVVLRGERVLLRPGRLEDAERLLEIRTEPEVVRWWGSVDIEEEVGEEFIEADNGFVIEADGEVVGAIQDHEENEPMYRHAGMDVFVTTSRHGQGLGTEALRVLARYFFEERGHHRLTIDPAADNTAAIRGYERVGFRKVGIMRRYERGLDGVGSITDEHLRRIAEIKVPDLNASSVESAMKVVAGTARSMGIRVSN